MLVREPSLILIPYGDHFTTCSDHLHKSICQGVIGLGGEGEVVHAGEVGQEDGALRVPPVVRVDHLKHFAIFHRLGCFVCPLNDEAITLSESYQRLRERLLIVILCLRCDIVNAKSVK